MFVWFAPLMAYHLALPDTVTATGNATGTATAGLTFRKYSDGYALLINWRLLILGTSLIGVGK